MSKKVPESLIRDYRDQRALVGVERDDLDGNPLHGFILDFNDEWIALQKEYDFRIDGIVLVRRADITALRNSKTHKFQKQLLIDEGWFEQIDFDFMIPHGGVSELLAELPADRIVTLEDEREEGMFLIGPVLEVKDGVVSVRFFSGDAQWDSEPLTIKLTSITMIAFSSSYTSAYERYFLRKQ